MRSLSFLFIATVGRQCQTGSPVSPCFPPPPARFAGSTALSPEASQRGRCEASERSRPLQRLPSSVTSVSFCSNPRQSARLNQPSWPQDESRPGTLLSPKLVRAIHQLV